MSQCMLRLLLVLFNGIIVTTGILVMDEQMDIEVNSINDAEDGVMTTSEDELDNSDTTDYDVSIEEPNTGDEPSADVGNGDDDPAKSGHSSTKKVFVPVYVPHKVKKKMKIIAVDKGFYINGGTQLFGKFKSLKACMKACAGDSTCFQGDYNPWLHKCYKHSNYTACGKTRSHPQFVHFSKIPCSWSSSLKAFSSAVTVYKPESISHNPDQQENNGNHSRKHLSGNNQNNPTLSQPLYDLCQIKVDTVGRQLAFQACFAIDYDFASHKCYIFGSNVLQNVLANAAIVWAHCNPTVSANPTSSGAVVNEAVIHITFCPKWVNFG